MSIDGPVAALSLEWTPLPQRPSLGGSVVHLVAARVPDGFECSDTHWSLLSEAEIRRAMRLKFDHHRHRWVAGRSLLKRLLARYADCDPETVRLGFGTLGKPHLGVPEGTGIRFNYTDSGGHLIYAVSRGLEVGVDLEILPRPTRYAALARRKLSPAELAVFSQLPEAHREHAFLAHWTRKEAYGKALGVGIRFAMHEVTLCEDYARATHVVKGDALDHHLVQVAPPFPGIACVVAADEFALEGYTVDADSSWPPQGAPIPGSQH